jgi:hypothetical protein
VLALKVLKALGVLESSAFDQDDRTGFSADAFLCDLEVCGDEVRDEAAVLAEDADVHFHDLRAGAKRLGRRRRRRLL